MMKYLFGTPTIPTIKIVPAGCENAGKTTTLMATPHAALGTLPSGLCLSVDDPRKLAALFNDGGRTVDDLTKTGVSSTTKYGLSCDYALYEGTARRLALQLYDTIGQQINNTTPDSDEKTLKLYDFYLKLLQEADVCWLFVHSTPPRNQPQDLRRFHEDCFLVTNYLAHALTERRRNDKLAVALVWTKTDLHYKNPQDARSRMTEAYLKELFREFTSLVQQSDLISDAAIFPITAMGFGNAHEKPNGHAPGASMTPAERRSHRDQGPIYLLDGTRLMTAWNLRPLIAWSMLHALPNLDVSGWSRQVTDLTRVCQFLKQDLDAMDPHYVALKSSL